MTMHPTTFLWCSHLCFDSQKLNAKFSGMWDLKYNMGTRKILFAYKQVFPHHSSFIAKIKLGIFHIIQTTGKRVNSKVRVNQLLHNIFAVIHAITISCQKARSLYTVFEWHSRILDAVFCKAKIRQGYLRLKWRSCIEFLWYKNWS